MIIWKTKWIPIKEDKNRNYVLCKRVSFTGARGEDVFFLWIDRNNCIESMSPASDELYLNLVNRELNANDIRELMALFLRYKINTQELERFKTRNNVAGFEPLEKRQFDIVTFELEPLKVHKKTTKLLFRPPKFYSEFDRDIFFEWIQGIPAVARCAELDGKVCLYFKSKKIAYGHLLEITALFRRYKLPNAWQLQVFVNKNNQSMYASGGAYWTNMVFGTKVNPKILKDLAV